MPIVNVVEPTAPVAPVIEVTEPLYKGITVDTKYVPSSSLLVYVEGSNWEVNYYSQVLGEDNSVQGQDVNLHPVLQAYRLIEKFQLKVTSPLTTSQASDTKDMILVGSANVFPFLVPNEGDIFLADVGDGREGVFKVTGSERRSIFKDTCYFIEYRLLSYSTAERRKDLSDKVISTFVFSNDYLAYGQNPLIEKKEYAIVEDLQKHFKEITKVYFKSFFSNEFKTLLIPGQEYSIYDHFVVKAVKALFGSRDAEEAKHVRLLNIEGDNNMKTTQLWDVLLQLDRQLLNYSATKVGLVDCLQFERNPTFDGIAYSGIRYAVYPKNPVLDVDYELKNRSKIISTNVIRNVPSRTNLPLTTPLPEIEVQNCDIITSLIEIYIEHRDHIDIPDGSLEPTDPTGGIGGTGVDNNDGVVMNMVEIPDIHLVTVDEYYVLSENFYNYYSGLQPRGMSKLEVMVARMLNGKSVDNVKLLEMCESYHYWGAVERYYYLPILLLLIRYSLKLY